MLTSTASLSQSRGEPPSGDVTLAGSSATRDRMDDEIEEAVDAFRAGVDRLLKPSNETRRVGPENYDVEEPFEVDLVRIGEAVSGPDEAKEVSPWYLVCEVATPVNVPSKHWGKFIDRIEESEDYKVMYAPFKDVTNPHRLPDSAKGLIVRDVE